MNLEGNSYKDTYAASIVDTDDVELQEFLLSCLMPGGTELFCKTVLPDSFKKPFTDQRRQYLRDLEDDTVPRFFGLAYRGFAKSTFLWAYLVKCLCFRLQPFTLYTSQTLDHASAQADNIRQTLVGNPVIRDIFGALKPQKYEGTNPAFSKTAFYLADPVTGEPYAFFSPRGEGQQVNGSLIHLLGRLWRPTLIASDDGENRESVLSYDLRVKHREWYYGALQPCVQTDDQPDPKTNRWRLPSNPDELAAWRPPWRMIHQDTLKHEDCNMAYISQSPEWVGGVYPLCRQGADGEYYSEVPELVTNAEVRSMVKSFRKRGQMDRFAMEYMCQAQASESQCWNKDTFKYYEEEAFPLNNDPHCTRFMVVDPAKTSNQASAFTAMLVVAVNHRTRKVFFRHLVNERLAPEDIYEKMLDLAVEFNTPNIAIEVTGLEDHLKYNCKQHAARRGMYSITWKWLKARRMATGDYGTGTDAAKRARGSMVLPLYKAGDVLHEKSLEGSALERQMLSYPKSSRWDALDTAGYVPQILEDMGAYYQHDIESDQEEGFDGGFDLQHAEYQAAGEYFKSRDWYALRN